MNREDKVTAWQLVALAVAYLYMMLAELGHL